MQKTAYEMCMSDLSSDVCSSDLLPMGIIGTVADFNDEEGYRAVVHNSRRFGFAGASCIHPKVVAMLNDGFGPSPDEIAAAKRVVEGFEVAKAQGRASITVDGKMIDYPIVDRAERLLALAARIEAKTKRA